jgi:hypothetical protein
VQSNVEYETGHQLRKGKTGLRRYFWAIYLATSTIWIRSLVRAIEFAQPSDGMVNSHEYFVYVFDAFPIFVVLTALLLVNPGRLVHRGIHDESIKMQSTNIEEQETGFIREP